MGARARLLPDDRRRARTSSRSSTRSSPRSRPASAPASRARPGRTARSAGEHRAEQGYLHCGPSGAGHFVKMVHNGIEYGLMAAYAEGLNILTHANVGTRRARRRRRDDAAAHPEHYSVRPRPARRSPRSGGAAASSRSWLLDLDRRGARARRRARRLRRARLRLGRGPLDARRRDRRGACRRRCSRGAVRSASARAARPTSPTGCCRRCATSSAATSSVGADTGATTEVTR